MLLIDNCARTTVDCTQDIIYMAAYEVNFDGLVGPTHNYAGLAHDNLASTRHALLPSEPKKAVMQGLAKMQLLMQLGVKQAILPPHERPNIPWLKRLGFSGSTEKILQGAFRYKPELLAAAYSASSMWAANAATISPSMDSMDGRLHITPANLINHLHRHQEAVMTRQILKMIFAEPSLFAHHDFLPCVSEFADEGAANHNRLCLDYGGQGIELFAYNYDGPADIGNSTASQCKGRQSFAASSAVARLHQLHENVLIFAQQNPEVVVKGVFHNDVIAVVNKNVIFYHEDAFVNDDNVITEIQRKAQFDLHVIRVSSQQISLEDAINSYLFNSQIVTLKDGTNALIAPVECQEHAVVSRYLDTLIAEGEVIKALHYVDCRQSMRNGGGPACLRLRIVLNDEQLSASHQGVYLDKNLMQNLVGWANKHYRDRLTQQDLLDPHLGDESQRALDELSQLLDLGSIYLFQQE